MASGVEYFLHQGRHFQHTGMGRKLGGRLWSVRALS